MKVKIGVVDVVNVNSGEDVGKLAKFQRRGREQELARLGEQLGIYGGDGETGHLKSLGTSEVKAFHIVGPRAWWHKPAADAN